MGGTTVVNGAIVWRLPQDAYDRCFGEAGARDELPLAEIERHMDRIERDLSIATTPGAYVERSQPSGLEDVVDVILDKGMIIDAFMRIAPIGTETLAIDGRNVMASMDTYLRLVDAVNYLDIS